MATNDEGCADTSDIYEVTNANNIKNPSSPGIPVAIFPNPAIHTLWVSAPVKTDAVLSTVDGRVLLEIRDVEVVHIENLPAGMYLLQIRDKEGHLIKAQKIVKSQN